MTSPSLIARARHDLVLLPALANRHGLVAGATGTGKSVTLLEKIEQVVRLIRSKGVGVYFVTQNPLDIPEIVRGVLGSILGTKRRR